MSDPLIRLREIEWSGKAEGRECDEGTTCWHRNPDGPEAAAEIERLRESAIYHSESLGVVTSASGWASIAEEKQAEIERLREENQRLLEACGHTHVAQYDGDDRLLDRCGRCGLDLRHPVHRRAVRDLVKGEPNE